MLSAESSLTKTHRLHGEKKIAEIQWSPDGETLTTVAQDGVVTIWDVANGTRTYRDQIADGDLNSVSHDDAANIVATAAQSQTISIWDHRWNRINAIRVGNPVLQVKWSSHKKRILAAFVKTEGVRVWSFDDDWKNATVIAHEPEATYFDWHPNGNELFACSPAGILSVDIHTAKSKQVASFDKAVAIAFCGNGNVAVALADGKILVFRQSDWSPRFEYSGENIGRAVLRFSNDGRLFACCFSKGRTIVFETSTWSQKALIRSATSFRTRFGVAFSPNGKMLATLADGCRDVQLWQMSSDDSLATIETPLALVMKGGGIKGLAYVGALEVLRKKHQFNWFIGTSAGAIVAILLGAGYKPEELRELLIKKDFCDFFDAPVYRRIPNLLLYKGMHPATTFTNWMDELLAKKLRSPTRVRLSDLPHRVTVYACRRDRDALTFDSLDNDVYAAFAARCSISIPFVFTPQSDQGLRAYDGGLRNNFPVDQLLRAHPNTPFLSLYLGSPTYEPIQSASVLEDLVNIVTGGADHEVIKEHRKRTIIIDPRPVSTLDFGLSESEKDYLLAAGRTAAFEFIGDQSAKLEAERRNNLKESVVAVREQKMRRRRNLRYSVLTAIVISFLIWCTLSRV